MKYAKYPVGSLVRSIGGEMDCDNEDNERHSGPNAWGDVRDWCEGSGYSVVFVGGVWVHLEEEELDDASKYVVVTPAQMAERLTDVRQFDTVLNTLERVPDGDAYNYVTGAIQA